MLGGVDEHAWRPTVAGVAVPVADAALYRELIPDAIVDIIEDTVEVRGAVLRPATTTIAIPIHLIVVIATGDGDNDGAVAEIVLKAEHGSMAVLLVSVHGRL